jgi:hypothetical protein
MTYAEAKRLHEAFAAMRELIVARLPQEVDPGDGAYDLHDVDAEALTATYRRYAGRGEHEYHYENIDLEKIFGGRP